MNILGVRSKVDSEIPCRLLAFYTKSLHAGKSTRSESSEIPEANSRELLECFLSERGPVAQLPNRTQSFSEGAFGRSM